MHAHCSNRIELYINVINMYSSITNKNTIETMIINQLTMIKTKSRSISLIDLGIDVNCTYTDPMPTKFYIISLYSSI